MDSRSESNVGYDPHRRIRVTHYLALLVAPFVAWLRVGEGEFKDDPALSMRIEAAEQDAIIQLASLREARVELHTRHSKTDAALEQVSGDLERSNALMRKALGHGIKQT